jgi:hypothetical protein
MIIHTEMMQMLESGTFGIAHLKPWLREFAMTQECWRLVSLPQTTSKKSEKSALQAVCAVVTAASPQIADMMNAWSVVKIG